MRRRDSIFSVFLFSLVLFLASFSAHATPRIALVYDGPGACKEACALSAAEAARAAGLEPVFVGPASLREGASDAETRALFANAEVWIQPGGVATQSIRALTGSLRNAVREFVRHGGGYVGFCAGAFTATAKVGSTDVDGYGIFPGRTRLYSNYKPVENPGAARIETLTWEGRSREVYFEGGPVLLDLPNRADTAVIANYDTGYIAAARSTFGEGRVAITGLHPEAPAWWNLEEELVDADGGDVDLAAELISYAAGPAHW